MTDGASQYLNMKATEYSKAGYPHHAAWAFTTDNHDEQRIHNELKAHGLIKQFTNTM